MKKRMMKLMAMSMAAMMVCQISTTANAEGSDDVVTLTIWNTEVLTPGVQTNEVAKEIEKRLGIRMEIVQGDAQKFSILTAGGDLPDIIYTNPDQQNVSAEQLITSGQVIPLDDLIEEYGSNIKDNFPERLTYSKEFGSNGEGKTYFLPILGYEADEENPNISYTIKQLGLMTRWDVYKAIGCPEIQTTDDYLNVLKQMQDYAREKDLGNGLQVWAISGWSDWGLWPWYVATQQEMGYLGLQYGLLNTENGTVELQYTSDAFWDSLAFYNKAYNMGILDPEAFTMKNDQFWDKCNNGLVLMAYASWQTDYINQHLAANGHADWGYEKLPSDGMGYVYGITSADAPIGSGMEYATAITKNCENPEKAMELLNFLNSEEGARLLYSGIEGVHWTNEDGVVKPTEEYLANAKADSNYKNTVGVNIYNKLCGFKDIQVLSDGYPADLSKSNEQKAENCLDIDKDYCTYYAEQEGGEYAFPGQVLHDMEQKGEIKTIKDYLMIPTLAPAADEETQRIISQCDQYMSVQGVKAIMSASEEEFEKCKEETLKGLADKGYNDTMEELEAIYAQALENEKALKAE